MYGISKYIKQISSQEGIGDGSQKIIAETKTALVKAALRFELRREERKVYRDGVQIRLTPKEYEVIEVFVLNPGRIFSKEELVQRFWHLDFVTSTKVVNVYVKNLRAKLGDETIETVNDTGYRLHGKLVLQKSHATIPHTTTASPFTTNSTSIPKLRTLLGQKNQENKASSASQPRN